MHTPLAISLGLLCLVLCLSPVSSQREVFRLFENCRFGKPDFDLCVKKALNSIRPWFKTGLPEFNVAPFDPHKASVVEQVRGDRDGLAGYRLRLLNVSEWGWAISEVTKFKTDYKNNQIIYSQYFPEKGLNGEYEFESKLLGSPRKTKGSFNLTLFDYSQTTTVSRIGGQGGLLKVRVAVDKIGDMKLHISDLFHGARILEQMADFVINTMWQPSLPFVKPLINDLVSTAFTDIFNESFRYFPLHEVIH